MKVEVYFGNLKECIYAGCAGNFFSADHDKIIKEGLYFVKIRDNEYILLDDLVSENKNKTIYKSYATKKGEIFVGDLILLNDLVEEKTEELWVKKYNLEETVIRHLYSLQKILKNKRQVSMSIYDIIIFLDKAMNYGEMQIWMMQQEIKGIKLSFNDKLSNFLKLKSDQDILNIYDIEQNYDLNNINFVKTKNFD